MYFKTFKALPVGWGSLNYLIINHDSHYKPIVITDGGSLRACLRDLSLSLRMEILSDVILHKPRVWIISHFDYDHFSLISHILDFVGVDVCVVPYVYSISKCREALAVYFLAESLQLRIPIPSLPRALKSSIKLCRGKTMLARKGMTIKSDDHTELRIIWPSHLTEDIEKTCDNIRDELWYKILKGSDMKRDDVEALLRSFLEELDKLGEAMMREQIELNIVSERDIRREDIDHERLLRMFDLVESSLTLNIHLEPTLGHRSEISYLRHYWLLQARERLLNKYSIAYYMSHQGDAYYNIERRCPGQFSPNRLCSERSLLLPLYKMKSAKILYLGDLGDRDLDEALGCLRDQSFDVVIAAHHGNSWSPFIKGRLAYISRCDYHVTGRYSGFRREYCIDMPCVISGHDYQLSVYLDL